MYKVTAVFSTTTSYLISQILTKVFLNFWKEALFIKIICVALNRYLEVFLEHDLVFLQVDIDSYDLSICYTRDQRDS